MTVLAERINAVEALHALPTDLTETQVVDPRVSMVASTPATPAVAVAVTVRAVAVAVLTWIASSCSGDRLLPR